MKRVLKGKGSRFLHIFVTNTINCLVKTVKLSVFGRFSYGYLTIGVVVYEVTPGKQVVL